MGGAMLRALALVLVLAALVASRSAGAASAGSQRKGASVSLRPKWQGTSLLIEASEFLAQADEHAYWRFLDSYTVSAHRRPLSLVQSKPVPATCGRTCFRK